MKNIKLKNIIISLVFVIILAIVGYVSSIFYMERIQEGIICDRSDKSLEVCNNVEAKYSYNSIDNVYYVIEINGDSISSKFVPGICIINAQNLNECIDNNGKKWMIMFNSYMD